MLKREKFLSASFFASRIWRKHRCNKKTNFSQFCNISSDQKQFIHVRDTFPWILATKTKNSRSQPIGYTQKCGGKNTEEKFIDRGFAKIIFNRIGLIVGKYAI